MKRCLVPLLLLAIVGVGYGNDTGEDWKHTFLALENRVRILEKANIELKESNHELRESNIELKDMILKSTKMKCHDMNDSNNVMMENNTQPSCPGCPIVRERLSHLENLSMINSLRSCHEYSLYGINISGNYYIDPDGPLIGLAPIEVYCDFNEKTTQFMHDKEFVVDIPQCEGDFCFRYNITYSAPLHQITTLIDLSDSCEQEIIFSCFQSALSNKVGPVGVWINRHGDPETYFEGSHHGVHMCKCSLDGTCSDSIHNQVCNCDANFIPEVQEDRGKITNTSALPISSFVYGDMVYSSQIAQVEVGRLKCRGEKQMEPKEITENCSNLKRGGVFQSGNYVMSDGSVAFCDMSKSMNENDIQTMVGELHYKDILFVARIKSAGTDGYVPIGNVTFNVLDFDYSRNFDNSTGVFTASKDGLYQFFLSGFELTEYCTVINVRINGNVNQELIGSCKSPAGISPWWYLNLTKGDQVQLENTKKNLYITDVRDIFFMGLLVN